MFFVSGVEVEIARKLLSGVEPSELVKLVKRGYSKSTVYKVLSRVKSLIELRSSLRSELEKCISY